MRHHNANRKFGRVRKVRTALTNSLMRSLILRKKIITTEPKAKEIRPLVEKLISRARVASLGNRRLISTKIGQEAAKLLVDDIAKTFDGRAGGYTRISKIGERKSDGARMASIELVQ